MPKLSLEQAASQYAWALGRDDYPAVDQCPYHPIKSRTLHDAYWTGWYIAAKKRKVDEIEETAA